MTTLPRKREDKPLGERLPRAHVVSGGAHEGGVSSVLCRNVVSPKPTRSRRAQAPAQSSGRGLAALGPAQLRVARLVALGHADKVIAARIGKSEDTVAYHVRRLAQLLGLDRTRNIRTQIAARVLLAAVKQKFELRKRAGAE